MRVGCVNFSRDGCSGRDATRHVGGGVRARGCVVATRRVEALAQDVKMTFMALQAEEGLILYQHVVGH